ncbi:MAG: hypothetical protein J6Z28_05535, partial [Succinivibrio sp.]|nr:hypothetical protein [Succinivibrio sp.]
MTIAVGSTSNVNAIKGTEFEGMSIQMMAAMVMLEVGATKKKEAENKIAEMKSQNDRAKELNNLLDRMNAELGKYTKDEDSDKKARGDILAKYANEAKGLGVDVSGWSGSKSGDQVRAITSSVQH